MSLLDEYDLALKQVHHDLESKEEELEVLRAETQNESMNRELEGLREENQAMTH